MKSRQISSAQLARVESLAERFGMKPQELIPLVIEAGIVAMERRLAEHGNHPRPAISQQQAVVLDLLQQGKTVKEIAYQLNLGEATIRTHISRIKEKLNCNDLLNLRMNGFTHHVE